MKKIFIWGWLMCLSKPIVVAQQQHVAFYYFQRGNVYEKTIYNAKNDMIARQEYHIVKLTVQNDASSASIQMVTFKDSKETERTTGLFLYDHAELCVSMGKDKNGGDVFVNYPTKPDGKLRSDINFETEAKLLGKTIKTDCSLTNRKILSTHETVTTTLGTWNCIKTSYDLELRGKILLGINIPVNVSVIEWFAPNFGIVRTDIFRNGKLHERRLLTGVRH